MKTPFTDFITGGDLSDLSDLSEESDFEELPGTHFTDDEDVSLEDEGDDVPISSIQNKKQRNEDLGGDALVDNQKNDANPSKKHKFTWRKKDTLVKSHNFVQPFTEPPFPEMTPYQYFRKIFPNEIITDVVEQTNLYSYQKKQKNIMTTKEEIRSLIGVMMKMDIVSLPSYKCYWLQQLRYSPVAVMSRNRFQLLLENLHFVNNDEIDKNDKLAKIRPIVDIVRNQCIEVEPEEDHRVDEHIIPSKTKFSSIRQYNPKRPKKWGFKNLVRAGSSGIMYDFFIYEGKPTTNNGNDNTDYDHLQKSAQVVAKLCQNLPSHKNHNLFFDNWFSTLELMLYLKNKGILAVGTIRLNRLGGCSVSSNKDLKKTGRGSSDYRTDNNSGIIVVKWVDNNVVQLISNFVGIEPMTSIERWCKKKSKIFPIHK